MDLERRRLRRPLAAFVALLAVAVAPARHTAIEATSRQSRSVAQTASGGVADSAEELATILQREPENAGVAFDWAMALERLANRPAAIAAWKRYLELDPSGERAPEARARLAQLMKRRTTWEEARMLLVPGVDRETVRRVVAGFPQRVRKRSQNVLLPQWAASGRAEELGVVRLIAEERASRDPYLLDIVINAERNGAALAGGLRAFAAAFDADNHQDTMNGLSRYSEAAEQFERAGSPLAIGAGIYAASMAQRGGANEDALRRLADVERRFDDNRYPSMAAELEWVRAIALMQLGEMQRSLDGLRKARQLALRSGENENAAFIASMIATDLELLLDPAEAVDFRIEALRGLDDVRADVRQMISSYFEAGYMALRNGGPHVAMAYLESAAELARRAGFPSEMASSAAQRAYALWETGRPDRAEITLDGARRAAIQLGDAPTRDRILSEIEYINGRIDLRRQPGRAFRAFRSAIGINQTYAWHIQAAAAYTGFGEAALAAGDRGEAERAFRGAVAEMEYQRQGIAEPAMRVAYFDRAGLVFEHLIGLLLDSGRIDEALTIVERKRARALLDQVSGSRAAKPLDAASIVRAVGKGQALLELTLLDPHAAAWLVHDGTLRHAQSTATGAEIEQAVRRQLKAIRDGNAFETRREGRWLYEQLIAPVARDLPPNTDLVIAADGILQRISFATLVAGDGRYLIEHYALSATPSASVFLRDAGEAKSGESLVAVAQPAPPGLEALPNVTREIEAIARLYRRGRVLVGRETSPDAFLAAAREASLVHFAGHARTDLRHPSRSALLFESEGEAAAPLTAEMIGRDAFRGHPLVVLAACSTGRGRLHRNEGIDSLAAAFLQGGARGVVATLWDVEDSASSDLFRTFHRSLRGGARAADALRDAQLSLLHGSDPRDRLPSAWGSTVVIGTF